MLYAPSVPLPRVIFPALVGTTTASRNALRLASPAARMPPRHDDEEGDPTTVLLPLPLPPPPPPHDVLAIYARTHARTHATILVRAHLAREHAAAALLASAERDTREIRIEITRARRRGSRRSLDEFRSRSEAEGFVGSNARDTPLARNAIRSPDRRC